MPIARMAGVALPALLVFASLAPNAAAAEPPSHPAAQKSAADIDKQKCEERRTRFVKKNPKWRVSHCYRDPAHGWAWTYKVID